MDRIDEKAVEISGKTFYISKIPAVQGREIMIKYYKFAKDADNYEKSHEVSSKLLSYVRVKLDNGNMIALETDTLINNHVSDATTLIALETAVMDHTFGFLADGETSNS